MNTFRKPVLARKPLVVLALVPGGNFIGKQPFKYVFAKLQVEMERNFCQRHFLSYQKRISHLDVFIILQLSGSVGLQPK